MLETSLRPSRGCSNLNMHMNDLAGLLKCRFLMPWGRKSRISNRVPGGAAVANPGTELPRVGCGHEPGGNGGTPH